MAVVPLHVMKPVLVTFDCSDCERIVTVNITTGEIHKIIPGDDDAAHDMECDGFSARSYVLTEEEAEELLCPV